MLIVDLVAAVLVFLGMILFVAGAQVIQGVLIAGVIAQAVGGPVQESLIVSGHQKVVYFWDGERFVLSSAKLMPGVRLHNFFRFSFSRSVFVSLQRF